jgi:hypothetical protein
MKIQSDLSVALISAVLAASVPLAAHAQKPAVKPAVVKADSAKMTFLNGGFGKEERNAMYRIEKAYPLRMTLSERKDGELIADVPVVISDAMGNQVFELHNAGPILFVKLPKGKYKVSARFGGLTESQEAVLDGKHGENLYFHWKRRPKA